MMEVMRGMMGTGPLIKLCQMGLSSISIRMLQLVSKWMPNLLLGALPALSKALQRQRAL